MIPGGSERRVRKTGGISVRTLTSGAPSYHARLHGKHVGSFATRREAEAALAQATAAAAAWDAIERDKERT